MLLPWVVSPLAVAAVLEESLLARGWGDRWEVAAAFALVAVLNAVSGVVFGPLLGRTHENVLEVFSRLLGVLLAAVGVQLFLVGLTTLGVISPATEPCREWTSRPPRAVRHLLPASSALAARFQEGFRRYKGLWRYRAIRPS